MNIYIARDGTTYGPYSNTQVIEYLKQGVFNRQDYACFEGESDWRTVADILPSKPIVPPPPRPMANAKPTANVSKKEEDVPDPASLVIAGVIMFLIGLMLYIVRDNIPKDIRTISNTISAFLMPLSFVIIWAGSKAAEQKKK